MKNEEWGQRNGHTLFLPRCSIPALVFQCRLWIPEAKPKSRVTSPGPKIRHQLCALWRVDKVLFFQDTSHIFLVALYRFVLCPFSDHPAIVVARRPRSKHQPSRQRSICLGKPGEHARRQGRALGIIPLDYGGYNSTWYSGAMMYDVEREVFKVRGALLLLVWILSLLQSPSCPF